MAVDSRALPCLRGRRALPCLRGRRARLGNALLAVGYPLAWGAGAKLVPVFRERRVRRFAVLESGTACVTLGLVLRRRPLLAAVNATALAGLAVAWFATGRRHL